MPGRDLSILIIDENRMRAQIIEDGLREAGHTLVTVLDTNHEAARRITEIAPDVVVIDLENPNRDRLEHYFSLSRALKKPIAMFVDRSDSAEIEAAVEAGVSAYVVDGLKKERVKPILDMAISRFNAFARLTRELEEARSALEDRKLIDQAKGILIKSRGISEAEALKRSIDRIPIGRLAEPEEIAAMVVFAASPRASYLTGTIITMDGASFPVVV